MPMATQIRLVPGARENYNNFDTESDSSSTTWDSSTEERLGREIDDKAGTKDVSVEELALEVRELRSGAAKAEMRVQEVRALSRGIAKKLRKIKHDKMRYIRPGGKRFYTTLRDLRKQLAVLDSQKEELEAQNAVLQREIKNLQSRGSTSAEQNGMDTNSVMDHGHTQLFDLNNGAENFHRQLTINVKAKEETT